MKFHIKSYEVDQDDGSWKFMGETLDHVKVSGNLTYVSGRGSRGTKMNDVGRIIIHSELEILDDCITITGFTDSGKGQYKRVRLELFQCTGWNTFSIYRKQAQQNEPQEVSNG